MQVLGPTSVHDVGLSFFVGLNFQERISSLHTQGETIDGRLEPGLEPRTDASQVAPKPFIVNAAVVGGAGGRRLRGGQRPAGHGNSSRERTRVSIAKVIKLTTSAEAPKSGCDDRRDPRSSFALDSILLVLYLKSVLRRGAGVADTSVSGRVPIDQPDELPGAFARGPAGPVHRRRRPGESDRRPKCDGAGSRDPRNRHLCSRQSQLMVERRMTYSGRPTGGTFMPGVVTRATRHI